MSDESQAIILTKLAELKTGQDITLRKVVRCEAILYGREEDDKPGLGERVRKLEERPQAQSNDELWEKFNGMDRRVVTLETKQGVMAKALLVVSGAVLTLIGRIVFAVVTS